MEAQSYTFRPARASDLSDLVQMAILLQEHLESSNPTLWRRSLDWQNGLQESIAADMRDTDKCMLIAEWNGEAVGVIVGQIHCSSEHIPTHVGSITRLFVHASHRRSRVGTQLVAALCAWFGEQEVEDINVRYVCGNIAGERFWEELGFQPRILSAGTNIHDLIHHLPNRET